MPLFFMLLLLGACRGEPAPAPPASSTAPPIATPSATATAIAMPSLAASVVVSGDSGHLGERAYSFDADAVDGAPAGFSFARTGDGREGKWSVRADDSAPSGGKVLAQSDQDRTDYRFPIAVADVPVARDVDVSVRCKPVSGSVDQACGLVFRAKDAKNYYVTRANALEGNVRLYTVKDGKRVQIADAKATVATGKWHALRVVARGDKLEVHWNGAKIIDHRDSTFSEAGKVGVWTKADSVTHFDDLRIMPL